MPVRALRGGPVLARACDALPCPKIEEPIGAFVSSWEIAEDCLQQQYKKRFPNNAVGFNKDWVGVPGSPHEQRIIDCLTPHFTAKGFKPNAQRPVPEERQGEKQRQAEPDIIDFTKRTIMEITTPKGRSHRIEKVANEVRLANQLMSSCGIESPNLWQIGWWKPDDCYQVAGVGKNLAGELYSALGLIMECWSMFRWWISPARLSP